MFKAPQTPTLPTAPPPPPLLGAETGAKKPGRKPMSPTVLGSDLEPSAGQQAGKTLLGQ